MTQELVVLVDALRLRARPVSGTVLAILAKGQTVVQRSAFPVQGATWLHVSTQVGSSTVEGYVHNRYVMPSAPAPQSHRTHSDNLTVTQKQLLALAPTARAWIIDGMAQHFGVMTMLDTARRLCHFLAQAAHESDGFRTLEEYGGPSYWQRYENRADLGNTQPDDGTRYHGRGLFQLTGRANYRTMGASLGIALEGNPELAATPRYSLQIARQFWISRKLERHADANDIHTLTRRINGGLNGLEDRKRYFRRAWSIWGRDGPAGV